jgi:hypothetical protein
LSDAGPGVEVSNNEVKFRDAEMCRIFKSDYRIRIHRAREDSAQGEAERTNSASGDAICDGGAISWEYYKRFEHMTDEDIGQLTIQKLYNINSMKMNAWR